jgi:hypothetical protein
VIQFKYHVKEQSIDAKIWWMNLMMIDFFYYAKIWWMNLMMMIDFFVSFKKLYNNFVFIFDENKRKSWLTIFF